MRSPQGHRCRQSVGEPSVTMAVRPDTTSATLSYGSARLNPTFTPPFGRSQLAHPEFELGNVVWAEGADSGPQGGPPTGGRGGGGGGGAGGGARGGGGGGGGAGGGGGGGAGSPRRASPGAVPSGKQVR